MGEKIKSVGDLEVYKLAFHCAMEIFQITKTFPPEEKYSLTDQIRRSSRSVCSNLAESWRKRRYKAVFKNKLTDAITWLEFCCACNYINKATFEKFHSEYEQLLAMLNAMDKKAGTFCFSIS